MQKKLNHQFVLGLKPGSAKQVITDAVANNLRIIVYPTGRKVWSWQGKIAGKVRAITLGQFPALGLDAARGKADEINDAKLAKLPIPYLNEPSEPAPASDGPAKTVDWLWELYLKEEGPTLGARTLAERKRVYKKDIQPEIGNRLAAEIDHDDLVKILRKKKAEGYGIMSNNLCSYIRRLFRWSATTGRDLTGMKTDPAQYLTKLSPVVERDRFLSDREIGYFFRSLHVCEESFGEALTVALYTGMRRSEVFGLRWSEVKLDDRWLDIPKERIKNGLALILPLSDTVLSILKARQARTGNYAYVWPAMKSWSEEPDTDENGEEIDEAKVVNNFSRPVRRLNAACQALAKKEGHTMESFTIHDLRRTLSSGMHALKDDQERSLVPTDIVERVINHTIGGVRGTYNRHDYRVEKREALNHWAQHLDKIRLAALAATERDRSEASENLEGSPE